MISTNELILRLVLASILGGLIGIEREVNNRPAGLRTHILVTVGSALIMLVSMFGFKNGDPARLSAQVVSGIGFLGAGTIIRDGNSVSGLTTAACIWVCGGIGLAIGNGYYEGACITTGIVLFALLSLGFLEKQIFRSKYKNLKLICIERTGLIGDIGKIIANNNITIKDIKISNKENSDEKPLTVIIKLKLKTPGNSSLEALKNKLYEIQGIQEIIYKKK